MLKTGLCSITFRDYTVDQIIEIVKKAGLDGIEWGADVHVLPGDLKTAQVVKEKTLAAGLEVASYGSYYRVGLENEYSFEEVLATADALGVRDIRVWAGREGSREASADYWNQVITDGRRIANLAAKKSIRVSFEYHRNTLTDTPESTKKLLESIDHDNIYSYWQPAINLAAKEHLASIELLVDKLTNIHVFQWRGIERLDLQEGYKDWAQFISAFEDQAEYLLLEFVKDDALNQFYQDAETLKKLIEQYER